MARLEKVFLLLNFLLYSIIAVFSYSYVDLNLTLSQNKLILSIVNNLQYIGYYKRPQATAFYIFLVISAFIIFSINLYLFKKNKIGLKYLKVSIIINTLVLIFAYPFLSSDLFNYLFDAKIITTYHASPYTNRPLDFPTDDWLRFMRWVHRYSPYGPLWLATSTVPSILGFGKFLLTFFLFKIFIGSFHLFNTLIIYKSLKKINPKQTLFGTAFYALNPILLIEGVANSHNDIVLATFLLMPIYFFVNRRKISSFAVIILGTLIKYIPILNLPWLVWASLFKNKKIEILIILNLLTMAVFTITFSTFRITVPFVSSGATQVQFQPWYLFWTIPFIALVPQISLIILAIGVSIGALLRYLPFLYYGDWSQPGTTLFLKQATLIPIIMMLLIIIYLNAKRKKKFS